MKAAAAIVSGLLLVATPVLALPEPDNNAAVVLLEESADDLYFVPADRPAQDGATRDVWVFAAHKTPPNVEGNRIVGSWIHDRVDCGARTLAHLNGRALKEDLTVAFTDEHGVPARPVNEGSVDEAVLELLCGAEMTLGAPVAGVREAVRTAQAQAN